MAFNWNDCCTAKTVKFCKIVLSVLFLFLGPFSAMAQSGIVDKAIIRNNRIASFGLIRSSSSHYVLYHQNLGYSAWNVSLFNDGHQRLENWSYVTGNKGGVLASDAGSEQGLLFFQKDFRSPALIWFDPSVPDSLHVLQMVFQERVEPKRLWIFGETAWIGATHKLTGFMLLKVDLRSGSVEKIALGRSERLPLEVQDLVPDPGNDALLMLLRFKSKRQSVYWVQRISSAGQLMEPRTRINNKEALYSATVVKTAAGWLVTGSVSLNADKTLNGFFTCALNNELGEIQLQLSSLQSIPNFFQYLNGADRQRIFQHADNLNKYKRSYEINTRIFTHDAIQVADRILVAYEFYYPTFIQRTQFTPQGWHTYQEFDGFQYTHAVIFEYSDKGGLLHDYCLPMTFSRKPFVEQQQLFWHVNQEGIVAAYMDAEMLRTTQLSGTQSLAVFKTDFPIAREDISGKLYENSVFSHSFLGQRMLGLMYRQPRQVLGDSDQAGMLFLLKYNEK